MSFNNSIEPSLQVRFQTERLSRTIKECEDIEILREIASHLLNLHQKKSAIAQLFTKIAIEAEQGSKVKRNPHSKK